MPPNQRPKHPHLAFKPRLGPKAHRLVTSRCAVGKNGNRSRPETARQAYSARHTLEFRFLLIENLSLDSPAPHTPLWQARPPDTQNRPTPHRKWTAQRIPGLSFLPGTSYVPR